METDLEKKLFYIAQTNADDWPDGADAIMQAYTALTNARLLINKVDHLLSGCLVGKTPQESAKMTKFQEYRKDRQEILYHPVKVTDEGIRLMVTVIDQMEATMRRFINYELPDCMAREEMKSLLDGPPVPGPEDELTQLRTRIAELEAENICLQKGMEAAEKVINLLLWVGLEDGVEKGEKWLVKYGKEQK